MAIKNRVVMLEKMEEKVHPQPRRYLVYFHDDELGFATLDRETYYPTERELFEAQGWEYNPNAMHIKVEFSERDL